MRPEIPADARRIAVVRALHLGDLLLAVPALRGIRAGFPDAEITLVGLPWCRDFVRRFGRYVDRFSEFPGYPGLLEVDVDEARTAAYLAEARAYGYDLAIQMHGSGRASNPFALELGARCTVGYYDPASARPDGLAVAAPYPSHLPEVLRNLGVLDLLGVQPRGEHLEFPLLPEDRAGAAEIVARHGLARERLIGLHVGARPPARRWPAEHFARLGDELARRHGAGIVLTGGPGEEDLAAGVAAAMSAPGVNLAGATSIGTLAALMETMDLFVSNDTGPAHLAVALDVPSIAIFGPADQRRWAPLDQRRHRIVRRQVWCNPCPHWECPYQDHACLRWVAPEDVLRVAEELLEVPEDQKTTTGA